MKIATFNINSINARLDILTNWLKTTDLDIVFLQEIKCEEIKFPLFEINSLGYEAKVLGQKSYNGVAILSKHKLTNIIEGIPNFEDTNSRYLQAEFEYNKEKYLVASIYLPNGAPIEDENKFGYKLKFMEALYKHIKNLLKEHKNIILGGDFNTILTANDVYNEKSYWGGALYHPEVMSRFKAFEHLGVYDAYRAKYPTQEGYTYFDYMRNAFNLNNGLRIDYFLISPALVDRIEDVYVNKELRAQEKPSDHTPLILSIK
ncbi:MAG: exodeoxyribonuclease III [Alphaproteobacteria bacterium]